MAFLSKDELYAKANKLGIKTEGVKYQQLQGMVSKAMKGLKDTEATREKPNKSAPKKQDDLTQTVMGKLKGKTILVAPEIKATPNQIWKYDEDLGPEVTVEEKHVSGDDVARLHGDGNTGYASGTYNVTGHSSKHVIAQSTRPKQGFMLYFRPEVDLVPVAYAEGRAGYLWTHQTYPNIKQLLIDSGYYHKYKDQFVDDPAIWHAAGKVLVCDINLVHSIFAEIEETEREKEYLRGR